uniref:Uncharacterized protein n=1 Tax=Nelumbo nucifera TaxID=4432 RepID=A0A822Z1R8_NELNU|nr:TPA_asm: hypothetical protein HUJ06_008036 [Nelumbo nucifera]
MAAIQLAPAAGFEAKSWLGVRPPTTQFLEPPPRARFSAVRPPRFVCMTKRKVCTTLETIAEEDCLDGLAENSHSSSASSSSVSLLPASSSCFLEAPKPFSAYSHNCQCA